MDDPCKYATVREHRLAKLVKEKLRLEPSYLPNIEELVAMNAVKLEEECKELHKPNE